MHDIEDYGIFIAVPNYTRLHAMMLKCYDLLPCAVNAYCYNGQ